MSELKYSPVYEPGDFTPEDLEFVKKGTRTGSYILIGSDNKEELAGDFPKGKVGLWAFGLVNAKMHSSDRQDYYTEYSYDVGYGAVDRDMTFDQWLDAYGPKVFTLHTTFEKNEDGMPWGGYSFDAESFKYVRFVTNPYGEVEFDCLPSEKALEEYRKKMENHHPDAEQMAEMRAAFGAGETVVNIITGQTIKL